MNPTPKTLESIPSMEKPSPGESTSSSNNSSSNPYSDARTAEIQEAINLIQLLLDKKLITDPPMKGKVKSHLEGVVQGLTWALNKNHEDAASLVALLNATRTTHEKGDESVSLSA